jgi:hypothetical protein
MPDLPSVVVAETFSTPLLSNGDRVWSYAGRLAIRLFHDEELLRPRIHARVLGRRGRTVFDALLTHPVVYSDKPVGCSLWLEEPDEEVRGWCFRVSDCALRPRPWHPQELIYLHLQFDDPLTARQFATLASLLTEDDAIIRRNVRRIEQGEWDFADDAVEGTSGGAEGSWLSRRLSWVSSRS